MFAVKCASYLYSGVSVIIVDVVTERAGNLHDELLELLQANVGAPSQAAQELYANAYRTVSGSQELRLETWTYLLALGAPLPTLPLWLASDLCLPLDLETTYHAACLARRIAS